jgi:hypothetical protein
MQEGIQALGEFDHQAAPLRQIATYIVARNV